MADQKFNIGPGIGAETPQHTVQGPLFDDEDPLDLDIHGGLVVLDTGQIAEVTPTRFIPEGGDTSLSGARLQPLPFEVVETEDGRSIHWRQTPRDEAYTPATPTIGLEMESLTMRYSNGRWWNISEDGEMLRYPIEGPEDGWLTEPAERRGHQPELLKNTTEDGSPVEELSRGYGEFKDSAERQKYNKQAWMADHGLAAVPLGTYPESVTEDDITDHPYTQMLKRLMPRVLEYAACLSEQINIQWESPEAGAFALNAYEMLAPVLGLVTASSPARDGSLYTTLEGHYGRNPDFAGADNAIDYEELHGLVDRELGPFMDTVPYDWRELARGYGSPGGGVMTRPAPVDIEGILREGDRQLRTSEAMTVNRVFGTHANRWRPDKNVVEIANLSVGGDHPDKMAAAEEMVIKTVVALQEYYRDAEADLSYDPEWLGIIPPPYERDDMTSRERLVDVARVNTMVFTMFGKDRKLYDAEWQERTPTEIFEVFAHFIGRYGPEPLCPETMREIHATLQAPPEYEDTHSINEPLADFFKKGSSLTATEALRRAEPLDDLDPPIHLNHVMRRLATYAYRKRMERHEAKLHQDTAVES